MHFNKALIYPTSLVYILFLSGCANTAADYQPIVDGRKGPSYNSDLNACKHLAQQREYLNADTKSETLLGAGVGAVIGAISGNTEDIIAGTVVGGAFGAGERAWETRNERKQIVIKCMTGRGHRVVG